VTLSNTMSCTLSNCCRRDLRVLEVGMAESSGRRVPASNSEIWIASLKEKNQMAAARSSPPNFSVL
jgi:hypothetical protein